MKSRRAIGHIIAIAILAVVLIVAVWGAASYVDQRQLRSTYITGTFQGYTSVNTGSGDQYIVRVSNATVTCDSWGMTTTDIYTLTHVREGQTITMSLACSNIVVG